MKRTSNSKALVACLLVILLTVLYTPNLLLSTGGLTKAEAAKGLAKQPTDNAAPHFRMVLRFFAPFWQVGDGYVSNLIIRNTSSISPVSATPIIFTADKGQIRLAALRFAPNEVKKVSRGSRERQRLASHVWRSRH